MTEDKNTTIIITVIFLAFIVIAIYFLFFREEEDYKPPDLPDNGGYGDGDSPPPGFITLRFDKSQSNKNEMKWFLNDTHYVTLLSGTIRIGGEDPLDTEVKISVRSGGSYTEIGRINGRPHSFTPFEFPVSMEIDAVRWKADWLFIPHYIDEVNAYIIAEV